MTTALRTIPAKAPASVIPTPTVDRLLPALQSFAESGRLFLDTAYPPPAEIDAAASELARAIDSRPTLPEVAGAMQRLVGSFPQAAKAEDPKQYLAALMAEASGYPLDVLAKACRTVVRECKFLPAVAELVDACEAEMKERYRLLRASKFLAMQLREREEARLADERRAMERLGHFRKIETALEERYGDRLPVWLGVSRAWDGMVKAGASWLLVEQEAAEGNGGAFVAMRRAALYALAREMAERPINFPDRPQWFTRADVQDVATHLAQDRDAEAAAMIEPGAVAPIRPDHKQASGWIVINATMKAALSQAACCRVARAEGLPMLEPAPEPAT